MGGATHTPVWGENDLERRTLRGLFQVIGLLREQAVDMPAQQMLVLIYVGLHEGCAQKELVRDLALPNSTASRNVAALSEVHRLGKPGLGLVTWVEDPEDRRSNHLYLTVKGRHFLRKVLDAL